MTPPLDIDAYVEGVRNGHRATLARAITLVESHRPDHVERARELLSRLLPHSGAAYRVGITGVPGVGKSTFIDALGSRLTQRGNRVAVLAVDPSSTRSGGSVLGDKTRMARLAVDPNAYVRPSPTAGTLGGVAGATRETMILMEAAGFNVVLVETVGVGQSEVSVAGMVDSFLYLTLARTGDQLQGIKRGVMELVDVVAVNKADGPYAEEARKAARELSRALRLFRSAESVWEPPVLTCSGLTGEGLDEVWKAIEDHRASLEGADRLAEKRANQRVDWMWTHVRDRLMARLRDHADTRDQARILEERVRSGEMTATAAAERLLAALLDGPS